MSRVTRVDHQFVEFIPDELAPNTIYVSMEYGTAVHACLCGCGHRVITPITPTDWHLTYDGDTISLRPSVGNWSFPCLSHYVIRHNNVIWAEQWSQDRIEKGRVRDKRRKERHYSGARELDRSVAPPEAGPADGDGGVPQAGCSVVRVLKTVARRLVRRK
jgi:hypothetical protein